MSIRQMLTLTIGVLPILASAYDGPSLDLVSEIDLAAAGVDQTTLESVPLDKVFLALDTLLLSPDTGLSISCDESGKFTISFNQPEMIEGSVHLSEYLLQGPVLISKDYSSSCPLLDTMTLWGPTWSTPSDYIDADTTGVVIVQPIKITSISSSKLSFIGALKDYHSIMGYVDEDPVAGLEWLEPGHTPWEEVNEGDVYHENGNGDSGSSNDGDDTADGRGQGRHWPFSFGRTHISRRNSHASRSDEVQKLRKRAVPVAVALAGLVAAIKGTSTAALAGAVTAGTGIGGTGAYYLGKLLGSW